MKKLFSLFVALVATTALWASNTTITYASQYRIDVTSYPHISSRNSCIIAVDDYTLEDWDAVPAEYLVKLKQQGETMMGGLDSIWIYADKAYINLLVWYRSDSLKSKEIVPFHIYLNADGDNKTGGYDDWFLDGNAEYLLEGFLFEGNAPCRFNPAVFHWWGSMGGGITDQTTKTGWLWTDPKTAPHSQEDGWGADIPTGTQDVAFSQPLEGNKVFEIQIVRSMITSNWAPKFGIGFDIDRVAPTEQTDAPWEIFGILPNPTYNEMGAKVPAKKADVNTDWRSSSNNNVVDGITYEFKNGIVSVVNCDKNYQGDLNIPAYVYVDDVLTSVTTIGESAFSGCSGLTSVTIPNSVTTIESYAFNGCTGLKKTNYTGTIADWCKIKFNGSYSNPIYYSHNFYINDVEVKDLVIPEGIDTIGEDAFHGCSGLTSVTIPNSVTTIGRSAFSGCSGLTSVNIPNSVTTIGRSAFYGCSKLTSVTIPNSVTKIGNDAFYGCSGLTSVTIGNSVETIGESAFANCTYLTDVVIGANVTDIGCNAFAGDFRLENITCYAPITPNVCNTTFSGINKPYVYLYVPADYKRKYEVDPNWSGFSLHLIGAEQKPITGDDVVVTPSTDNATFTWPANPSADGYSLEITKDGVVFCTLKFNAQGQLTGIAFAPSRGGQAREMAAATMTANGWQFTVTGLNQASKYGYTLDALNASQQSIKHYEGEFATDGYVGLYTLPYEGKAGIGSAKFIRHNQLLIRHNGILYNALGGKVR